MHIDLSRLEGLPDYNKLYLYGTSCEKSVAALPDVSRLLRLDACGSVGTLAYWRDPACLTHQLLGVHLAMRNGCGDQVELVQLSAGIQRKVSDAIALDGRRTDAYIQRMLMLLLTSPPMRQVWNRSVLHMQLPDGGWDDLDAVIVISEDLTLGWSGRSISLRRRASNFHTTAKGLLFVSLLAAKGRPAS